MRHYIAVAELGDDGESWWTSFPGLDGVTSAAKHAGEIAVQARDVLLFMVESGGTLPPSIEEGVIPHYDIGVYDNPLVLLVPFAEADVTDQVQS